MKLFAEIRRRRVFPTLLPYLGLVWLILQVVSVVNPLLNLHPLVGTFITVLLFAGFPVMVYLSWYFDFTTEGLKLTDVAEGETAPSFGWPKRLILAAIMLISGTVGYLYFQQLKIDYAKYDQGIEAVRIAHSIAVLPFKDQSPDQDQAYLAEGLAEELSSLLGKLSGLEVAATNSSFILSAMNLMPVDIGRRLNVETILTGSIRVTGNKLKLRSELVDVDSGKILWTENFSREFSDIFQVEEEISRSIVNLLQDIYVAPAAKDKINKTASSDAYVIYLKGREQYRLQTTESLKQARKYFEQAIALDPEYVNAYVGAADAIVLLSKSIHRLGILEPDIASRLAEQYLAKAFVRQPDLPEAYAIQGKVFELQQQPDKALAAYDKAISLNPSLAIAHMWRHLELKRQNRYAESIEALDLALKLDPISIPTRFNRALEYSRRGQYKKAEQQFNQLIKDFHLSPMGHQGLADAAFYVGDLSLSLQHWKYAMEISPENINFKQGYLAVLLQLKLLDQARPLATGDDYKATLLLLAGQYDALFDEMTFKLASHPDDPWLLFEMSWYQMLVGDRQQGIELAIQSFAGINHNEQFDMPYCSPAIEFAWALQQVNRQQDADTLAKRCEQQLVAAQQDGIVNNIYSYLGARIAALRGQNELAATMLQQAVDNGWREWWTAQDPLLSHLQQSPEILKINQKIADLLETERKQALEVLAVNISSQ
jgi:TolB-like protein/TolA-binding protein